MDNKEVQQLKTTLNRPVKEVVSENIMFIWMMLFITVAPSLVVSALLQALPTSAYITGSGVASFLSVVLGVTTSRAMYKRYADPQLTVSETNLLEPEEGMLKLLKRVVVSSILIYFITLILTGVVAFVGSTLLEGLMTGGVASIPLVILLGVFYLLAIIGVASVTRPVQYLIILEPSMRVRDAIRQGMSVGFANIGELIKLQLKVFGITILGMLALFIGLIYTIPYTMVLEQVTMYKILGYEDRLKPRRGEQTAKLQTEPVPESSEESDDEEDWLM